MSKVINVNDTVHVHVSVSAIGKLIVELATKYKVKESTEAKVLEFYSITKTPDEEGFPTYLMVAQLHTVMKTFGHMFIGSYSPLGPIKLVE